MSARSAVMARRPVSVAVQPAQRLAPLPTSHWRDGFALMGAGVAVWGLAPLVGYSSWGVPGLAAGAVAGVSVMVSGSLAAVRGRMRDVLVESLAPYTGSRELDRRTVRLEKWTAGWPGVPRQVTIRYAAGAADGDVAWKGHILDVLHRRLDARFEVAAHVKKQCGLVVRMVTVSREEHDPVKTRVERTITELIGPTTKVKDIVLEDGQPVKVMVSHEAGTKLAAAGYRARIERTFSAVHPGRWRCVWNLVDDKVTFEVRPSFPSTIWLPPSDVDQGKDILATYDQVEIPYGQDEDGRDLAWRPAIDPNLMVVGSPGTGKALALDTPVPTPSGWTTMGDLVDGDLLFDETGGVCRVLRAHGVQYGRPCYRVVFSDGSAIVADADHLWVTSTKQERAAQARARTVAARSAPMPRLSEDQMQMLRDHLAEAEIGDVMSLPQLAQLVGRELSKGFRRLAAEIGQVGVELRPETEFTYRAATTTHVQKVAMLDRREVLLTAASASSTVWRSRVPFTCEQLFHMADVAGDEPMSSIDVRELFGWSLSWMSQFMGTHTLRKTYQRMDTPRELRAYRTRRPAPGRPIGLYPKRELLEAMLAWAERRHHLPEPGVFSRIRTTEQVRETLRCASGHFNHSVALAAPIDLPSKDLPIDPYVLGAWLGDGTSRSANITSADPDLIEVIRLSGYTVSAGVPDRRRPTVRTYRIFGMQAALNHMGLLKGPAARAGRIKHIPADYLRASIAQRRALLAGLMDTDGTVDPQGSVSFTSTVEQLAHGVHELACSLGFRPTIRQGTATLNGRNCGPTWMVAWTTSADVFRLPRKLESHRQRRPSTETRTCCRYITAVDPIESVPVRCITVDSPNAQYLVGDALIPTHNTVLEHTVLVGVSRYGWPIWVVDGKAIEFLGWRTWPNVQIVATTIEQQIATIHRAWQLMEYRYKLIVSGQAGENDFEPMMLFLDEFADFRANLMSWYATVKKKGDPTKPPVLEKVASIARKGRSSRIHLLFATQRPDAEYFGGDMRDNFRARISMGRLSPQGAMMMWQDPVTGTTVPRGCRGRATTIDDNSHPVEIQTYRVPDPRKMAREHNQEHHTILDGLRPAASRHDRLLICPPDGDMDDDSSFYRLVAGARWVRAGDRPDLDPLLALPVTAEESRAMASPMAMFGLGGTFTAFDMPDRQAPASDGGVSDGGEESSGSSGDVDVLAGYGPAVDVDPESVAVGDLVLVDDAGMWAVVDEQPDADLIDTECMAICWRDDADNQGILSVPFGERVTIRHPLEEV